MPLWPSPHRSSPFPQGRANYCSSCSPPSEKVSEAFFLSSEVDKRRRGCYSKPPRSLSPTTTCCLDKPVGASINRSKPGSPSSPLSLFWHTGLTAETRLRLRRLHSSLSSVRHLSILRPIVARALGRRNETGRSTPCSRSVAIFHLLPGRHKIELRRSLSTGQRKQREIRSFTLSSLGG